MAQRIDGKKVAATVRREVAQEAARFRERFGRAPGLSVVLAGDDPASAVYVRNKEAAAKECGFEGEVLRLPNEVSTSEVLDTVLALNERRAVDGILVQLPLPRGVDEAPILEAIDPRKDVDGFHVENVGALWSGLPGLVPCTPSGCMRLLREARVDLAGKRAVVLGRSNIVGKPMAALLLREHATVTVAHSRTQGLPELCREADVLVAAVGRAKLVKASWVKPGAVVIDVGMNRDEQGKLCGDVDYAEVEPVAGAITPVPGGVGPMTIAMLMQNTLTAALAIEQARR
ncbi:MAG: bifunctional methylenetetrahydrofolate dehydrogenase/methenyltetrahydrofolate cyclohydrolase FolD [Polyangiaceae bacterium]|nr:bifunctional methylenetetrahydrofolate dehydrogenase/methenyltetrahydrofolate cyclohydrolase FolD [Polyangiaceae bacterium]MCW5791075.1 bifunctional methylenetetrahydrofolate dehydrogenase/methenyltetrahydrofolate cyclohydrolase FolD [Polyangiaceae bacterium]